VTTLVPQGIYLAVASQLQAAMVRPWTSELPIPETCTALLCGPGLAGTDLPPQLKAQVAQLWKESPRAMIVDASALEWLPAGRIASRATRVITPHPGEAARMLGGDVAEIQSDRPAALRELSKRLGHCWVVLKGHQTVVGAAKGALYINSSGNPLLAQGGSGDVLAGFLSGLLTQPALDGNPLLAARYAVWQHGTTADHLSAERANWTVEDMVGCLGDSRRAASAGVSRTGS
jgi:NAD(P)H-hydrate epimerase